VTVDFGDVHAAIVAVSGALHTGIATSATVDAGIGSDPSTPVSTAAHVAIGSDLTTSGAMLAGIVADSAISVSAPLQAGIGFDFATSASGIAADHVTSACDPVQARILPTSALGAVRCGLVAERRRGRRRAAARVRAAGAPAARALLARVVVGAAAQAGGAARSGLGARQAQQRRRTRPRLAQPLTEPVAVAHIQRRRNGGGDGGARPRNVETTGARVSFRPRNIFPQTKKHTGLSYP